MKKQRKIEKDNRGVAIYARKSRITNKGDSIGVQFKQCADYAKKELGLDEDYEFLQYEDKGLSGYFSDRPDFQRMLHDVQDGKIKAIVCYKLDRVGRKTADLIRLMDFLEMYHVNLLICSNGINTASGLYKIFIQIFAVIAEFERDTLTERIVDNMMELAKDGRWLGGNTPMGFTVRRVTTGSGKGKSAYSYLESLPEEKCMVQRLYEIFRTTRSIQTTAKQMNEEGFHTPSGAAFNASTTRLVLRNPIYCTADKRSYDYFIDHDGNVFGDMIEFDGTHGLSAYNKTDQEKYEGSDSTFISPKYVQTIESKPVSEWIIAVGRHEGFIPSEQWVEVQELLDAIAEKYNRPHRKTNALLAGLVHCPHCGRRLSVISESDRWTNGKPRFKYVCPGYRKKECNFKAVDGVLLDEFVVQQLSDLSDENSERFKDILEIKIEEVLEKSQTVQEHTFVKKKRDKLKADIAAQTRNLREADGSIKKFIQEDLQNLAEELRKTERQLSKLDEGRKNNMIAIRDLEMTKERLLSFAEYAKDAQPEVLVTLIQTIVERIYIVDKDDERYCHIFIKGCSGEDYTGFFRTAGYIEDNSTSVCDSEQCCITDERFDTLLAEYEAEQKALVTSVSEAESHLSSFEEDTDRAAQFHSLAKKYTDFSELTTPMINEFIEKIIVHAPEKIDGDRVQEVEIYLKFIGRFELPGPELTPEEIKRQEQLRRHRIKSRERYQKIKAGEHAVGQPFKLICKCCGEEFESKRSNTLFCSPKCRTKFYRQEAAENRKRECVCENCGKTFTATRKDVKYCCDDCRANANRRMQKERNAAKQIKENEPVLLDNPPIKENGQEQKTA